VFNSHLTFKEMDVCTPLGAVTCTTTGSRPRTTLEWTIGQRDVTSNATERSSNITASDTNEPQLSVMKNY
jgi:hypothetical protein